MKEIITITLAIIILTVNLLPFFIVFQALFPARLAKTIEIANRSPGRSFLVGLINFVFLFVMVIALFFLLERAGGGIWQAVLILPTLAVLTVSGIFLSVGLAAVSALVGERLAAPQSAWKHIFWGALLLGLGSSVPFVGWFLLLPYAAWVGMGAFLISFFQATEKIHPPRQVHQDA